MTFNVADARRGFGRARRALLAGLVVALATILSLPAIIYAVRVPSVATGLSAVVAIGTFGALITLVRRVWLQLLIAIPILVLNVAEVVHILIYGSLISLGGIEAVLHVDPHEAREFVSENQWVFLVGLVGALAFLGLVWLRHRVDDLCLRERLTISGCLLGLPSVALFANLWVAGSRHDVFLPTRFAEHFVAHVGGNPITQTLSGLISTIASRAELGRAREVRSAHSFGATRPHALAERELYIVVIGESSRRRNWSLYGYQRPTNPQLQAVSNLIAFADAVSPATVTTPSVAMAMSLAMPDTMALFHRTRSVVSAFREVGFRTFWLSNQGAHRSAVGNEIALMMEEAEVVRTSNFGFWNSVLDEKLLPLIDEALADPAPRKLVVIHTLGSHTNYRQRVPAAWSLASSAPSVRAVHPNGGITREQAGIVEDYDLTISYTDWFLHQVIERHRQTNSYGALIYFSDHGQRLFDDSDAHKGHGFPTLKREDVEVPLIIWLSDGLVQRDLNRRAAIIANAGRPVSVGRLAESLLDLAAINIGLPVARQSFFSSAFQEEPRTILLPNKQIVDCCRVLEERMSR